MSSTSDGCHPSFVSNSYGIWCYVYDKGGDVLDMYHRISPEINLSQNIASQSVPYLGFVEPCRSIDRDLLYDKFVEDMGHYYNVDSCAQEGEINGNMGKLESDNSAL